MVQKVWVMVQKPQLDPKFKAQGAGDVYYQAIVGRDEMPNFEKKITDEADRWALVAYIKGL